MDITYKSRWKDVEKTSKMLSKTSCPASTAFKTTGVKVNPKIANTIEYKIKVRSNEGSESSGFRMLRCSIINLLYSSLHPSPTSLILGCQCEDNEEDIKTAARQHQGAVRAAAAGEQGGQEKCDESPPG